MDYIGEHRLPGQLGHFFLVLSIVASLVATFAYFKSANKDMHPDAPYWKRLGRIAFLIEVASVFAVFGILFYIISNHLFEYKYAWQHSSRSLEVKYLLACFWEGQEGSFLLWSIWHCVLGVILMSRKKEWEAPVMTVVSFAQFCLATMIAGIYFFGWKMGSNPFILLRDSGVLDSAPALHLDFDVNKAFRPDYMLSIKDGNDLNPLLQNYWMVIHPPVLFMGFASTTIPFAFTIAGLWKKKFGEWMNATLPWALFCGAVLGVGIMMGGMWAYESLTFGGYWAWDPVENASLVPWMVMIAGIHTLLIYKHTGYSLRATHLFFILSFALILYSTFLTRSGILGETSVHAFTDEGMNWQLIAFMSVFVLPALGLFFNRYKSIPAIQKEESTSSREFWMFIASLVFFLSAIVIILKTSLPVLNKVFGTKIAPPANPEYAYNQIQVFVAIILGVLTAIGQYLKYKQTSKEFFWKKIGIPTLIAAIASTLILLFGDVNYKKETYGFMIAIWGAVVAAVYAIIANASYLWLGIKGKLKIAGGSIAHVGFGMVLLGILISSSKKEILSNNIEGMPVAVGPNENPRDNLTLFEGVPAKMGKYTLTYESDSQHPKKELWFYNIHFKSNDGKEEFRLQPNAFVNYKGREGLMANPSAKHYWDHDVFTYITFLPNPAAEKDTAKFRTSIVKQGDTVFYSKGFIILDTVTAQTNLPEEIFGKDGTLQQAVLKVHAKTGSLYTISPKMARAKGETVALPDTLTAEGVIFKLDNVHRDNTIELAIKESETLSKFITLKAYKFPFILLLWLGVVVTATGMIMSMFQRMEKKKMKA